jgi:hypothetical protein
MSDAQHEPLLPPLTGSESRPLEYVVMPVGSQAAPTQELATEEYRAAIESLYEHSMTEEESVCFRLESASKLVPLTSEQTRLLPPRTK